MSRKLALIIGNSQYQDSRLAQLVTPQEDVNDLAAVLRASDIGGFDEVKTLVNESDANIRLSIEDFFDDKKPDDLLIIYFSGHGVRDEQGLLYLAVNNTRANRLRATAIPSEFITGEMDRSRSRRQVLILDCCHSGAFAQGSKAMTGESAGTGPAFEGIGYGRVVLTATDATQYAWEGDKVIGQADQSVFTHYLIEGLRTGKADTDHDGRITLDEIYDYVYEQVVTVTPKQTPGKWSYKQQGEIVVARNPNAPARQSAPPPEILDTAQRIAAVKVARLLVRQGANPGAVYPLRAETNTIGRSEGLEVTVRDTLISRRHTRITLRDGAYLIEDLLSANGTFVNGQKLTATQPLKDGDQIAIGDTVLIFQQGETAPAAIADQPASAKPPATSLPETNVPPDRPGLPMASPSPAVTVPLLKQGMPKWMWIGIAGVMVVLFGALLANAIRPTPDATITEPATAVDATPAAADASAATDTPEPTPLPTDTPSLPTDTPPAPLIEVERSYIVDRCCGPAGTQISEQLDYSVPIDTLGLLDIHFEPDSRGCSDVQLHIFVDDAEIHTTDFFGPVSGIPSTGWIDLGSISAGHHTLLLRPEGHATGQDGDCNHGTLGGWGGTLQVRTSHQP